jgi:azurin
MEPAMGEPTITSWEKISENQLQIVWIDNIEGEDGYKIDKRIDNGEWIEEYAILDENASKWIDEDFSDPNDYSYRLYSYFKEFQSSSSEVHIINGCDDILAINYEVDVNLNDESCRYGLNVPQDYSTIQGAIDASSDGDTILVSKGAYFENLNYNGKNVAVMSRYFSTKDRSYITGTEINGSGNGRVVSFENGESSDAILYGFIIRNGFASEGGGIRMVGSTPTLRHLIIEDNEAEERGGGIYYAKDNGENFVLSNVIVRKNKTTDGVQGQGGGIYLYKVYGTFYMNNVLIRGNESWNGGGMRINNDDYGGSFYFENITIADNYDKWQIGGTAISLDMEKENIGMTIVNSILWNNCRLNGTPDCSKSIFYTSNDKNFIIRFSLVGDPLHLGADLDFNWTSTEVINADPKFLKELSDIPRNYSLASNSPCINAGDPDFQYNDTDGSRNDMGAYGGPGGDWNK